MESGHHANTYPEENAGLHSVGANEIFMHWQVTA